MDLTILCHKRDSVQLKYWDTRDTVYSRGKGGYKQKSEHYCLQ